jgi:glycosyltransferase involved in cell wall biosynthesis
MTDLRVVSLIDSLAPGGAERSLVELAPRLAEHGIDLTVALLYERAGYDEELRSNGTPVVQLVPEGTAGRVRQIRGLLTSTRAQVLHTTLYESDVLGRLAGTAARVPVVCTLANVRYGDAQYAEPGLVRWKLQAAQAVDVVTARAVRRFHAVSSTVADAVVVPRGRDERRLGRWGAPRRAAARRALGLSGEQPVVLAVSRHQHQKGHDVLIDATVELRARHTEVADLLGPRDEVPDLLCAADAFALPSRREGFPGAVVEAMALEVPMVLTDLPMVREAAPDDTMAWFVAVDDVGALTEALDGTLRDRAAAEARARAARARFEAELTIDAVARRMADLLRGAAR